MEQLEGKAYQRINSASLCIVVTPFTAVFGRSDLYQYPMLILLGTESYTTTRPVNPFASG